MNLLRNTAFRVFISLLGGGMVTEFAHVSTGVPRGNKITLVSAVILFGILTLWVKDIDNKTL